MFSKTFERKFSFASTPHLNFVRQGVDLVTNNPDSHMNLRLNLDGKSSPSVCLSPSNAKALRDALIEAYPLDITQVIKVSSPQVRSGKFVVINTTDHHWQPSKKPVIHITASSAETEAKRLADATGEEFTVVQIKSKTNIAKPVRPPATIMQQ